ncbi:HepT-like ribonuclease domain-containing protein [Dyadobacter fanqingshengii]|uniref:DUF86 domain-containing protein n=1 Tax=Dyadobacter fanqingshengii TaxID=2906443 RepID=A0A9X1PCI9_9BACT|nr:DUF86 domain-containing protein [Dyadobacter fanqingshengii]MCF0042461.1 DUF86 domain-containing protein [Dyadobacter fanqingshengii]USJ35016.1 DUF86 domain-containing protein [Dyadobacter fanqingshengii]
MSERAPSILFLDMLDSVETVLDYTSGMSFDNFMNDRKTRDAVIRNIQVLGEAANRVPKEVREQYPDIEWMRIIRSRHILVHDYAGIDFEIVWRIIEVHLPPLRDALLIMTDKS